MWRRTLIHWLGGIAVVLAMGAPPVLAQEGDEDPAERPAGEAEHAEKHEEEEDDDEDEMPEPVVTHHEIELAGATLRYTATAGMMPIEDAQGEVEGEVFYVAYTRDDVGDRADRPLMFSFNGGPGSASVWLHLGALGPKRVPMPDDATVPRPPYRLVTNEQTWLDATDLVFIDPVGTGYSRASTPEQNARFHSLEGDISSVGEFIRRYLTENERWTSPLYLVGESYGTTRAAGLSEHLVDHGIALNGIVLVSTVLNFQTLRFDEGNDLPYALYLPTYAATAWYHEALPDDLQARPLAEVLDEVEAWAADEYLDLLHRGDRLGADERAAAVARVARYTGLGEDYIDDADLRVEIQRFCKELLRDRDRTVGRLDSRFTALEPVVRGETPEFDPSLAAIRPPYTATINQYLRAELGFETDRPYYILGEGVGPWDFGVGGAGGYADTGTALATAMAKNPHMEILIASGYYDLATPYTATEYTLAHLSLAPELRSQVRIEEYEAGHMMYIHGPSLEALKGHVAAFIRSTHGDRREPGADADAR